MPIVQRVMLPLSDATVKEIWQQLVLRGQEARCMRVTIDEVEYQGVDLDTVLLVANPDQMISAKVN